MDHKKSIILLRNWPQWLESVIGVALAGIYIIGFPVGIIALMITAMKNGLWSGEFIGCYLGWGFFYFWPVAFLSHLALYRVNKMASKVIPLILIFHIPAGFLIVAVMGLAENF